MEQHCRPDKASALALALPAVRRGASTNLYGRGFYQMAGIAFYPQGTVVR
jgi:hypothetical protein